MPGNPPPRHAARAALLGVLLAATACTGTSGAGPEAGPTSSSPASAPAAELKVRLIRVEGHPVEGHIKPRRLWPVADHVRDTIDSLYTAGFVDPAAWRDGRFTEILPFFRGEAQGEARRDANRLTLGPAARHLAEVHPKRARLRVDILTDAGEHPVAALAHMRFAAAGLSGDGVKTPIRHRAEYLLRRFGGRWQIVAYRVKRHLVPRAIPGVPDRGSLFVLALGSDARPRHSVTRSRADSIHIIGVNLTRGRASILGIPRDSYVPIPGHGSDKINASLFFGGPELTVRTVEGLTGIHMDGYLLTGFSGFRDAVDEIGGLTIHVPYPIHDPFSRAHFRRGNTHVDGDRALAFSRNRHDAPGGDLGRSRNQGSVILAALRELRGDVSRDPLTLFRWIQAATEHIRTDLSVGELVGFLYAALSIDPSRVRNRVVSGSGGTVGGASIIRLSPSSRTMFRDIRRDGLLGH